MQEQNSVLTCTNLCQSFQSQSIETVKQKQINAMIQNQIELEQTNNSLKSIIQRYNQDLVDYFNQNQNLIQQKQDLEQQNEALKKQIFNKNCQNKSTQTDLISKEIETQTERREFQQDFDSQQKQNQQGRIPKNEERFIENQNPKRKTWRECEKYQHSISSQKDQEQMYSKSIDCEYFESKKHLEKMLKKLTEKIQFLSDTINESQAAFQNQQIISCLQEIQAIVDYLKILINDQMAEIKKFADQVNSQVLEIIEEANKLQNISQKKQNQEESFKFISYTEFTQNSNLSHHFNNEESNLNKSSEYLGDPNCTIINTSRNTENLFQDSEIFNNQDQFTNIQEIESNLKQNNFLDKNLNYQNQFNPQFQSKQDCFSVKKNEENSLNKNYNTNFVEDSKLQEKSLTELEQQQEEQQKQMNIEYDYDSKLNENIQCSQIFNSQHKLNQTGSFLETNNLNESNDQISQYENLLETLGDEEFDLEQQINNKQNTVYNQYKKKPDSKSKAQIFNRILTFSFGNNPTSLCINNSQIPIQKQSHMSNQQENEIHLKLVKQEELNSEISNKLQETQKSYLNFVNNLLSLIGDSNTQITIEKYLKSDAQQQAELEKSTLQSQEKIISFFEKLSQFKSEIDAIQKQSICQSQSNVECITESTLEEIGQSFYADQIQKQFLTKTKMMFNQRIENIRRVKFNVESMKKIFRSNDGEICKQYDLYGITAADFIFLKQYIQELLNFMNQINQKTTQSIKSEFMERCLAEIDQLKVSSEFKILIEFLKQSIILKITIKSYC
ncbi:hypothetical protein TTHERM_000158019 (macronuclear) [Tetrahymena thermophila SB210]|uniref:Uncharacterized protein n=1 Tax=Tetrahymena thermophila (strain SB210) TaxID=312017 RepID=W7XE89_TETTS|nr:hypothetical protein TTHERM_000158019 [Tetrahymena thermophila SB210]EWS75977.1 hypothetical protein TTHERM_000158019 [Tetrahymena thermophila SB210]|eukprot:XP_012651495.1 hypothetical protein TTHERM_000158019 [Tetrahymena thermophila SB210]